MGWGKVGLTGFGLLQFKVVSGAGLMDTLIDLDQGRHTCAAGQLDLGWNSPVCFVFHGFAGEPRNLASAYVCPAWFRVMHGLGC